MAEEVSEEQQLASAYGIEQLQNNPQSQEVVPTAEAHTVPSATTATTPGLEQTATTAATATATEIAPTDAGLCIAMGASNSHGHPNAAVGMALEAQETDTPS